jgi:hypothetical protein
MGVSSGDMCSLARNRGNCIVAAENFDVHEAGPARLIGEFR